jgi:polyphosphate kinase
VTSFRYELHSAEQLAALASAALPLGISADSPRRTMHRDLYLDTLDDSLRRRGVVCRLRVGPSDERTLSLRIGSEAGGDIVRVDSRVRGSDSASALAEDSAASRRLRTLVDPAALAPRLVLEIERLTRAAHRDLLRRPRLELHYDRITVRREGLSRTYHQLCGHVRRGNPEALHRLAAELERIHDLLPLRGDPRDHAALLLRWAQADSTRTDIASSEETPLELRSMAQGAPELLSAELSLLAFQRRVLALAEDPRTPLRARLRFLGIVTSNLDELYMVRMPELRRAARDASGDRRAQRSEDGLDHASRFALVEREVEAILAAQSRCANECLRAAAAAGAKLVRWSALAAGQQAQLRERCRDEMQPLLVPMAMTMSPGHPLPHLPHLGLQLAVVFRRNPGAEPHLAELELPHDVARLLAVPGSPGSVIAIEEVLRANVDLLYPNAHVDGAHLFRVTRAGELALDEEDADDLLVAVSEATGRRATNPAVRVEVERTMPHFVGDLILESLRRDAVATGADGVVEAVQVVDGLLDLRCLAELPLPDAPELEYAPLDASFAPAASMLDVVRERDLLVHHPFDPFDDTVVRFLREAANDPDVTTIEITLYRVGDPSLIVEALVSAARAGKRVVALVELKARFDEEQNVEWARALERAGGHVVYGLVGFKVHAKVALVVRREQGRLRRYVHVGTGNYSARSGRQYTDLSLFSARDALGHDVSDLFNELTGSSRPPHGLRHGALVAPHQLLRAILERIERETMNARAGRPAAIAIKVNGLSDPEVVRALYHASQAGVSVDLVVRGICTLRPGVAGRSERIRVVSVVGRFLEHSRIYRFENGGAPEYFIGSSDLRPRNLRRRVELLVPVLEPEQRVELDRILALYLGDATGWELDANGRYVQRGCDAPGAQAVLALAPRAMTYQPRALSRLTPRAEWA